MFNVEHITTASIRVLLYQGIKPEHELIFQSGHLNNTQLFSTMACGINYYRSRWDDIWASLQEQYLWPVHEEYLFAGSHW